jgi:hypothetical protein
MGVESGLPRLVVLKSDFLPVERPVDLPFDLICELIYSDDFCPTIPDARRCANLYESHPDGICVVSCSPTKKSPKQ